MANTNESVHYHHRHDGDSSQSCVGQGVGQVAIGLFDGASTTTIGVVVVVALIIMTGIVSET